MGRRSRSRSRSYSDEEVDGTRLHIADLAPDCSKRDLEKEFERFGELVELWLARTPPCFGFAVFRNRVDAYDAMDELNGKVISGSRIKVSLALPRARERSRRPVFDVNMRCYQCGEKGHFARDCNRIGRNRSRYSPESRGRFRRSSMERDSRRHRSRSRSRRRRNDSLRGKRREESRSRSREVTRRRRSSDREEAVKEKKNKNDEMKSSVENPKQHGDSGAATDDNDDNNESRKMECEKDDGKFDDLGTGAVDGDQGGADNDDNMGPDDDNGGCVDSDNTGLD